MSKPGQNSFDDYLTSSFGDYPYNGTQRREPPMLANQPGALNGGGDIRRPTSAAGLSGIKPQQSATRMQSAVPQQTGPDPLSAKAPAFGGLTNGMGNPGSIQPISGGPGGASPYPSIPDQPTMMRPGMPAMPIQRPQLGMGAVERGQGFGGLAPNSAMY